MVLKESVTERPEGSSGRRQWLDVSGQERREELGKSGVPSRTDTQLSEGTKVRFPKLFTGPLADL